jgi:mRNA-degrading endonuclease YafQ of YafQ-DinJ toxin-antitoxin module
MSWTLARTETFLTTARKFFRRHPELKGEFTDLLGQLQEDPFVPRLRTHVLKGRHRGTYAVSLTYSFRVVVLLRVTGKEVILLDIGSHDEVYR